MKFCTCLLKKKLFCAGVIFPAVIIVILFAVLYRLSNKNVVSKSIERARAICMSAELISSDVEKKWKDGIYSVDTLEHWVQAGDLKKVLRVAPILGASLTIKEESKNKGYTFRVTGFEGMNGSQKPDAIAQKALAYMSQNNKDEYYEVDKQHKQLRYFRSIRTSEMCFNCHGNTTVSKMLRASHTSEDVVGIRLEKWKDGGRHGAYEVVQPLENLNTYRNMLDTVSAVF